MKWFHTHPIEISIHENNFFVTSVRFLGLKRNDMCLANAHYVPLTSDRKAGRPVSVHFSSWVAILSQHFQWCPPLSTFAFIFHWSINRETFPSSWPTAHMVRSTCGGISLGSFERSKEPRAGTVPVVEPEHMGKKRDVSIAVKKVHTQSFMFEHLFR